MAFFVRFLRILPVMFLAALPVSVQSAERMAFVSQREFVATLQLLGLARVQEGFEDDAVWGDVRSTLSFGELTAPAVTNRGITWTANNPDSEVTTGTGPALTGQWGFYTLPHGSYATGENCHLPFACGDGFVGTGQSRLYAVGGWVYTNTPYAKLGLFLDGEYARPVDFGETCEQQDCSDNAILGTQRGFFGVIDPQGFRSFEFRELEGTAEDQKFIFADAFSFAFAPGLDADGDGLVDAQDNCILVPNPDQRDTDNDLVGNICDPDFDQDQRVDLADFRHLRDHLGTADADTDLNGDGVVNFGDLRLLWAYLGRPPGPSGLID